jgi:hypothetical protein
MMSVHYCAGEKTRRDGRGGEGLERPSKGRMGWEVSWLRGWLAQVLAGQGG